MYILHINKYYPPWIGGIETIVADIAKYLQSQETDNTSLVCQHPKGTWGKEQIGGVSVVRAKMTGILFGMPISFVFFSEFSKQAKKADHILIHHPFPLGLLAYLLCGHNKPFSIFYHADIVRQRFVARLLSPLWNYSFKHAKNIFVTSERLKGNSPWLKKYQNKCVTVPLWIQASPPETKDRDMQQIESIRQTYGTPLVLSVGRLVYYKGYEYLIEALQHTKAHALIIGTGSNRKKLQNLLNKYQLEKQVHIIDPVNNLDPYYDAADMFVLPSINEAEAFGIVQLEAMSHGLPVINTNLKTGVSEVSLDKITGLTVEPKNAKELARAIQYLMDHPDIRKQYGQEAHKRFLNHFSKDRSLGIIKQTICKSL